MFLFFKYKCRENFNTYETDTYLPLIQNISVTYMYSVYIVFRMHIPGFQFGPAKKHYNRFLVRTR